MRKISYQDEVEQAVFRAGTGKLLVASRLYSRFLTEIPEFTYYKALERMVNRRKLLRLAKGIYMRADTDTGQEEIEREIIRYYTAKNGRNYSGFCGGGCLFEKYGLIDSDGKEEKILYTVLIQEKRRKIRDILLIRYPSLMDERQVYYMEMLELVAGYESYQKRGDFKKECFCRLMQEFAKTYDDALMVRLLKKKQYPKHTIAFLNFLLREYGCDTSLESFLAGTSKYRIPQIEIA